MIYFCNIFNKHEPGTSGKTLLVYTENYFFYCYIFNLAKIA